MRTYGEEVYLAALKEEEESALHDELIAQNNRTATEIASNGLDWVRGLLSNGC